MTLAPERFFDGPQLALAQAIQRGDLAAVRALAPQTDLRAYGAQQTTLLHYALHEALSRDAGRLDVMRELVACDPAIVHLRGARIGTVYEVALGSIYPDFLEALLDGGVSPDARAYDDSVPGIMAAALDGRIGTVRLLLDRGAQVDARNDVGDTAAFRALTGLHLDVLDVLLERGASVRTVNRLGVSFLYTLALTIEDTYDDSTERARLTALRDRVAWSDGLWPPLSPLAEREAMRARGEEPIVPHGQAR